MSSHIKDQQKQQNSEPKRDFDADHLFNQHVIKTLAYTGIGFGFGMLSSLFFKHRAGLSMLGAGTGAAYGVSNLYNDLNHFKTFQNYNNQQPQTLKRENQIASQDWKQFMPKEQSQFQQKNYQRGGSDDDDSDNKKGNKSEDDDRDLTYSQKIAEEAARQLSKKPSEQKDSRSQKSSPKEDSSQKSSGNKKPELNKKESSSKSQDQAKPQQKQELKKETSKDQNKPQQQQSSKKDQSKDQDQAKPQQKKPEAKKDQSKEQDQAKPQQKQELKKDTSKDQNKPQQSQGSKKDQPKDQSPSSSQQKQKGQDDKKELSKSSSSKETEKSSQHFGGNKQETTKKASLSKEDTKEIGEKSQQVGSSTFLKVEGQQFMDMKSNPVDAGKPAPGEKNLIYRGSYGSTKGSDEDLVKGAEQDRMGRTARTGNKMKLEDPDHSKAGSQFSGDNLSAKSQVNAVIE